MNDVHDNIFDVYIKHDVDHPRYSLYYQWEGIGEGASMKKKLLTFFGTFLYRDFGDHEYDCFSVSAMGREPHPNISKGGYPLGNPTLNRLFKI